MDEDHKLPLPARIILWVIIGLFLLVILKEAKTILDLLFLEIGVKEKMKPLLMDLGKIALESVPIIIAWKMQQLKRWALRLFNIWILLVILSMTVLLIVSFSKRMPQAFAAVLIIAHILFYIYFNFGKVKEYFRAKG